MATYQKQGEVIEKDDLYGDGWWQVSLIDLSLDFAFLRVSVLSYHACCLHLVLYMMSLGSSLYQQ